MGLILKPGKVFVSRFGDEAEAYGNFKVFVDFSAKRKYAEIVIDVYKTKGDALSKESFPNSPHFMIGMDKDGELHPDIFDEYLSDAALKNNSETVYEAVYRFISENNLMPDWERD